MLRRLIGDRTQLALQLSAEPVFIEADEAQIEQIVLNLAINARDAMPGGGQLTIRTEPAWVDASPHALLRVSDTVHGMDEATKARIYEAFFTTKEVGKGTGLGLWMVRQMVEEHRGTIAVESRKDQGTSFSIYLPLAAVPQDSGVALLAESLQRASLGGSETILIVEDDEAVQAFARQILEPADYRVLLANNRPEAAEISRKETGPVGLVIGAADPNALLAVTRPQTKVLCLGNPARTPDGQRSWSLSKPFTGDELLSKVREILDAKREITIIVADDDHAIRTFLEGALTGAGYRILEARNGRQVLDHLRKGHADLLITDLVMPEHEGLETIQIVKKEFPGLPIVAMSGSFGAQYLPVAAKLGADELLPKPFEADLVQTVVERLLKGPSKETAESSSRSRSA